MTLNSRVLVSIWQYRVWWSTVSGHRTGLWKCTFIRLGVCTLGVNTLGVYSHWPPILDLASHLLVLENIGTLQLKLFGEY